jgi:hypothetical protein
VAVRDGDGASETSLSPFAAKVFRYARGLRGVANREAMPWK